MTVRPVVNRRIIEALLETELRRAGGSRLALVSARYDDAAPRRFTARIDGRQRQVRVADEESVLGVVDAWQRHLADTDPDSLLVVTSGVPVTDLGWDVRAHAVRRRSLTVDRAEIVKQLFGATDLDPRFFREPWDPWLLDALLDAEPVGGWPRGGAVLTLDTAVRALVTTRLGLGQPPEGGTADAAVDLDLDADALLAWSRGATGPDRFTELSEPERAGLTTWLTAVAGAAVPTLLALVADGRGQDAMALGVLGSVLKAPGASTEASFALGGLFGSGLRSPDDLPPFTDAVTGTLARWIAEAEGNGQQGAEARQRVFAVLDRADKLASDAGLRGALHADPLLPSGFRTRLRDLAAALDPAPEPRKQAVGAAGQSGQAQRADSALALLLGHQLAKLYPDSCEAARMAARAVRWLARPAPAVESVAQAVSEQVAHWGWADRALTVLSEGDPIGDPVVGQAYHRLIASVRDRRGALDEAFGERLAAWAAVASSRSTGGCLLIEDVLARLVAPLAARAPALVLVLDGMSSAVAAQLGEDLDRRVWTEVAPAPEAGARSRRQAAVSMLPSVTTVSRASLLTGGPVSGGQAVEAAGFAAFWERQRRRSTGTLFHKGRIGGSAGHRLAPELLEALAGDGVVGVVLNTIDDALDRGREGSRTAWRLKDVSYLPDLLNAARGHGRPVVLVSDHGHVLDRSAQDQGPVSAAGVESARWRTGRAGDGEVELSGPRVLRGGGTIVAPWREDIRYTPRKAGYHGGAAPAEVTVPVIMLVPSPDLVPSGWAVLPSERVVPGWWEPPTEPGAGAASGAGTGERERSERSEQPVRKSRRQATVQEGDGLFAETDVAGEAADTAGAGKAGADTLGGRVVASVQYRAQKEFVRLPPPAKAVAALVDALAEAGGKLSPDAVAAAAAAAGGRAQRNAERFVTVVQRLLNIEGYPVISLVEAGRTVELNERLLRAQFGIGQSGMEDS